MADELHSKETMKKEDNHESKAREPKYSPAELGAKLKALREAQAISVADVSEHTKIQKHYIAAIEDGNLAALPKGPYIRSFVKQYCTYLEATDLWTFYDELTNSQKVVVPAHEIKEEQSYANAEPTVFKPKSYLWIYIIMAISISAACWITWQYRTDISAVATNPVSGGTAVLPEPEKPQESAPESKPAVPASADAAAPSVSVAQPASVDLGWMDGKKPQPVKPAAPAAQATPVSADAPQPTSEPAVQKRELKIIPAGTVWIKVSQNRKTMFEGIIRNGEEKSYTVSDSIPLRVRFGNPGKTNVSWGGNTNPPADSGDKPVTRYYWSDGKVTDKL